MKHCAALLAVLAFLAGCGGDEPAAPDAVYKVAVTMEDARPEDPEDVAKRKQTAWVEWIDAVAGRWRIQVRSPTEPGSSEVDSKTAIYTGSLCFEDNSYGPPSLRMGSRGFLGACADDSIALEALRRHLADGREPPERFRGERGNVEFLATIVEAITRAEAEERGLFETPEHGADIARERKPSQSRDDPIATKTLARLRARTGTRVTLNNRESAAVFREGGALWFVTETTLVSVTGPVRGDARALAASLRAV